MFILNTILINSFLTLLCLINNKSPYSIAFFIVTLIAIWIRKSSISEDDANKISFNDFLSYYSVNKYKWEVERNSWYIGVKYRINSYFYLFYFNPIDSYKFLLWSCCRKRQKKKEKQEAAIIKVLQDIQKDINIQMKKGEEQIQEGIKGIEKVVNTPSFTSAIKENQYTYAPKTYSSFEEYERNYRFSFTHRTEFPLIGIEGNLYRETSTGKYYYWNGRSYVPFLGKVD